MTTKHPDYAILAARIAISNLHKETKKAFSGIITVSISIYIISYVYINVIIIIDTYIIF